MIQEALQVAMRMEAEINGLSTALKNANDAQAAIDTGEGALSEIATLLLRMRELAVQGLLRLRLTLTAPHWTLKCLLWRQKLTTIGEQTTWGY